MKIFDRFKKNKTERLEDNFQVRYIFSSDFDLENNKEIEKLYGKVVDAQDQRGRRVFPFPYRRIQAIFVAGSGDARADGSRIGYRDGL